tara:strand:+ start:898 stop:1161 length:264 start_codon:yes stop_codon:yes gene_type:complete
MPEVFWLLTWADFIRLLESHVYLQNQDWDRIRYQSTMVANCSMGRKKVIKPKDLFQLPHDKENKKKVEFPSQKEIDDVLGKSVELPI